MGTGEVRTNLKREIGGSLPAGPWAYVAILVGRAGLRVASLLRCERATSRTGALGISDNGAREIAPT